MTTTMSALKATAAASLVVVMLGCRHWEGCRDTRRRLEMLGGRHLVARHPFSPADFECDIRRFGGRASAPSAYRDHHLGDPVFPNTFAVALEPPSRRTQEQGSARCWAAVLEMLMDAHDLPLESADALAARLELVAAEDGALDSGALVRLVAELAQDLERRTGRSYVVRAYPRLALVDAVDPFDAGLIRTLDAGHPCILLRDLGGGMAHAVLVVGCRYSWYRTGDDRVRDPVPVYHQLTVVDPNPRIRQATSALPGEVFARSRFQLIHLTEPSP